MKYWKTHLALLCILVSSLGSIKAQSSVWKVTSQDSEIYLGGTIHLLRPSDYPLPPAFDSAYAHASVLVFETDIRKMKDPAIGQRMMSKFMLPEGESLSKVISKATYDRLNKVVTDMGLTLDKFEQFKPSMVMMMISVMKIQSLGLSTTGVDDHFLNKAIDDKKSLNFFETIEQQIDMMVNMGEDNQDEMVKHSLDDFDDMEKDMIKLLSNWKEGSNKMMNEQIEKMKVDYPSIYKELLVDRNEAWMPKIEAFFESPETEYVLVGTMHLHGEKGLLQQLTAKGYKVSQVLK